MTRNRILAAARHLFFLDGYAATTLKAVAAEAGVAVQTIYAVFGSKSEILAELRWLVVNLPEADAARVDAMQAPSAGERIRHFARSIRCRWELAGDIVQIDQDAVRVDPSIRPLVQQAEDRRQSGIAAFGRTLADDLHLPIDVTRLTAIIDALTMNHLYTQLVAVHGWSPDEYQTWLCDQLGTAIETHALTLTDGAVTTDP